MVVGFHKPVDDPGACAAYCARQTTSCRFFSVSPKFRTCVLCSTCALVPTRTALTDSYSAWSLAKVSHFRPLERLPIDAFVDGLQDNYSVHLYGARGRVPRDVRIVWLTIILDHAPAAHSFIKAIGGVCTFSALPPFLPLYAPQDLGQANPFNAIWINRPPALQLPSHSWVEITHCAQNWSRPLSNEEYTTFCNTSARGRASLATSQKARCYTARHRPWEPVWKHGFLWAYAAPGSGVSINVGVTRAFETHSEAEQFIRAHLNASAPTLPRERCDTAALKGPARALDTIQIVQRAEHFSREVRHEIIMLRHGGECTPLQPSVPGLRCGRAPHLTDCDEPTLARLSDCRIGLKVPYTCMHADTHTHTHPHACMHTCHALGS